MKHILALAGLCGVILIIYGSTLLSRWVMKKGTKKDFENFGK